MTKRFLDPKLDGIYKYKCVEVVPVWKQCGEYIDDGTEKKDYIDKDGNPITGMHKLWNSGKYSIHAVYLNSDPPFLRDNGMFGRDMYVVL